MLCFFCLYFAFKSAHYRNRLFFMPTHNYSCGWCIADVPHVVFFRLHFANNIPFRICIIIFTFWILCNRCLFSLFSSTSIYFSISFCPFVCFVWWNWCVCLHFIFILQQNIEVQALNLISKALSLHFFFSLFCLISISIQQSISQVLRRC